MTMIAHTSATYDQAHIHTFQTSMILFTTVHTTTLTMLWLHFFSFFVFNARVWPCMNTTFMEHVQASVLLEDLAHRYGYCGVPKVIQLGTPPRFRVKARMCVQCQLLKPLLEVRHEPPRLFVITSWNFLGSAQTKQPVSAFESIGMALPRRHPHASSGSRPPKSALTPRVRLHLVLLVLVLFFRINNKTMESNGHPLRGPCQPQRCQWSCQ